MDESCIREIYPDKVQDEYYVKIGVNYPQKKMLKLILCNAEKKGSDKGKVPPLSGKPVEPQIRCVGPQEDGAKNTLFSFKVSKDFYSLITTETCIMKLYIENHSNGDPIEEIPCTFELQKGRYRA